MTASARQPSTKVSGKQGPVSPTVSSSAPSGAGKNRFVRETGKVFKESITMSSSRDDDISVVKSGFSKKKRGGGVNVSDIRIAMHL